MSVLLSERVNDGHDALGEAIASFALGAVAGSTPQNESAELALGVAVGGFDAGSVGEGPEGVGVPERRPGGTDGEAAKISRKQLMDLIECSLDENGYVALVRAALEGEGRVL